MNSGVLYYSKRMVVASGRFEFKLPPSEESVAPGTMDGKEVPEGSFDLTTF